MVLVLKKQIKRLVLKTRSQELSIVTVDVPKQIALKLVLLRTSIAANWHQPFIALKTILQRMSIVAVKGEVLALKGD